MRLTWEPTKQRYVSGEHVRFGLIGTLNVWYDGSRPKGEPNTYAASVFGRRSKQHFATIEEAKAWCEKHGQHMIEDAMRAVGVEL